MRCKTAITTRTWVPLHVRRLSVKPSTFKMFDAPRGVYGLPPYLASKPSELLKCSVTRFMLSQPSSGAKALSVRIRCCSGNVSGRNSSSALRVKYWANSSVNWLLLKASSPSGTFTVMCLSVVFYHPFLILTAEAFYVFSGTQFRVGKVSSHSGNLQVNHSAFWGSSW